MVDSTKGLYYFAPVRISSPVNHKFHNLLTTNPLPQISQMPWLDYLLDKNPITRIGPKPTLTGVQYTFSVVASYQQELASSPSDKKPSRDNNDKTTPEHSLDKYIRLKQTHPSLVDDAQIVNYLMLNILAGGDTSSATMRATFYYLAKSRSATKKLTAELDAAGLNLSSSSSFKPAQWTQIKSLTYLDAVIRESLRINPGIAMIFERVVPASGFTLPDGRFIPAGTNVGINPAVTNRDKGVFGEDAESFNPDRWLKGEGETEEAFRARFARMRDVADLTFGGGNRVCMGRYLAMLEIYKLVATVYSLFDVSLFLSLLLFSPQPPFFPPIATGLEEWCIYLLNWRKELS